MIDIRVTSLVAKANSLVFMLYMVETASADTKLQTSKVYRSVLFI